MPVEGKREPRSGPARALWDAEPDADISAVLAEVRRYECEDCGCQRFTRPQRCSECGCETFLTVDPRPNGGGAR